MYKTILWTTALVALIGVLIFGALNRTLAKSGSESEHSGQGGYGRNGSEEISTEQADGIHAQGQRTGSSGRGQGASNNVAGDQLAGELADLLLATPGELSTAESAALRYMREEEKLAHDVYVTFYAQWNLSIFQNISQSEQTHANAVKALLDRYGLTDPASSEIGVFTNPDLQALYPDLVARGSHSLAEALKVAAAIEEVDILDLENHIAQTDHADIQHVYNNLLKGSYNHLRAFVSTLNAQTGATYQPQSLSLEAYQAIVDSSTGIGNGGGYGQGGNNRGGARRSGRP